MTLFEAMDLVGQDRFPNLDEKLQFIRPLAWKGSGQAFMVVGEKQFMIFVATKGVQIHLENSMETGEWERVGIEMLLSERF